MKRQAIHRHTDRKGSPRALSMSEKYLFVGSYLQREEKNSFFDGKVSHETTIVWILSVNNASYQARGWREKNNVSRVRRCWTCTLPSRKARRARGEIDSFPNKKATSNLLIAMLSAQLSVRLSWGCRNAPVSSRLTCYCPLKKYHRPYLNLSEFGYEWTVCISFIQINDEPKRIRL